MVDITVTPTIKDKKAFNVGSLYISDEGNIVLCTRSQGGEGRKDSFFGVCLYSKIKANIYYFSKNWYKDDYRLFEGNILLEQK